MQQFVELVGGMVGSVQKMFAMMLLAGVAIAVILSLTVYATAPVVAEEAGDRVQAYADKQLDAAMEEQRARECDRLKAKAAAAWNDAVDDHSQERAYAQIDEIDRQAERVCNS